MRSSSRRRARRRAKPWRSGLGRGAACCWLLQDEGTPLLGKAVRVVDDVAPHAAELRFPIGQLLIHGLWVDGTLANVFAQHQDDNVQAIPPSETPAPS